jgi:hypothetical protein
MPGKKGGGDSGTGGTGGGTGPGGTAPGGGTNAEIAYHFFISHGLSPGAAAGILGNLMVESGINPGAIGDGGSSFGIAQWHLGRADALRSFAGSSGQDWHSLSAQLAYLWHELQTSYGSVLGQLKTTGSSSQAASIFAGGYERPASTDYSNRVAGAQSVMGAVSSGNWAGISTAGGAGGGGGGGAGGGGGSHSSSTSTSTHPYQVNDYLNVMQNWGVPISPAMHAFAAWAANVVSGISTGTSRSSGSSGGGGGSITLPNGQVITTTPSGGSKGSSSTSTSTSHGLGIAEFQYLATLQPWFKELFPGIFEKNGALRMSPAAYSAQFKTYQAIASQYGRGLDRHEFGYALSKNVDRGMFADKLHAIQTVRDNPADFRQLVETAKARGEAPKGGVSKTDLYRFVMGEGPTAWNRLWEESWLRGAAANVGLQTGRDMQRGVIKQIMKQNPDLAHAALSQSGSNAVAANFSKLANDLKTIAPASRLFADHGLHTSDLAQLEFGGPRQAEIALTAQRALASYKAAFQPQAGAELGALGQRVGSGTQKSAVTSPFETP